VNGIVAEDITSTSAVNPLALRGWISEEAAGQIASLSGSTLAEWIIVANSSNFIPINLTTTISVNATFNVRSLSGTNVVARIGPPPGPEGSVIILVNHDHLGIVPGLGASTNDTIFNGAVDNAAGVAAIIAAAYAFGALYSKPLIVSPGLGPGLPERSIIFLSVTASESGYLGAEYFIDNSPCSEPYCGAVAVLNFDMMNVWGGTRDVVAFGYQSSVLSDLLWKAAGDEHMIMTSDPSPEVGRMYHSEELVFALNRIPTLSVSAGPRYRDKPYYYWTNVTQNYFNNNFHQPSDEYQADWSMDGVIQQIRLIMRLAYKLAVVASYTPTLDYPSMVPPYEAF